MGSFVLIISVITLFSGIWLEVSEATFLRSRNPSNVRFILFKDSNQTDVGKVIPLGNEKAFAACGYNASQPLIILIHDELSNPKTPGDIQIIKNAYLEENVEANILVYDYGKVTAPRGPLIFTALTSAPRFIATRLNVHPIARHVVDFISFGIQAKVISGPENVHIVGFGLGAQIAGSIGRQINRKIMKPIRRITGLDPGRSYPIHRYYGLDESDAQFVDVTFTSLILDVGLTKRGHAQFYINGGGPRQPNCPNSLNFKDRHCSHNTAVHYFAKSIKNSNIRACKCGSFGRCRFARFQRESCPKTDSINYGHFVPDGTRGNFFVSLL